MPIVVKGKRYFYHDTRWDTCRRCGDKDEDLRFGLCMDCLPIPWWRVIFHPIRSLRYWIKPLIMRSHGIEPGVVLHPLEEVSGGAGATEPEVVYLQSGGESLAPKLSKKGAVEK